MRLPSHRQSGIPAARGRGSARSQRLRKHGRSASGGGARQGGRQDDPEQEDRDRRRTAQHGRVVFPASRGGAGAHATAAPKQSAATAALRPTQLINASPRDVPSEAARKPEAGARRWRREPALRGDGRAQKRPARRTRSAMATTDAVTGAGGRSKALIARSRLIPAILREASFPHNGAMERHDTARSLRPLRRSAARLLRAHRQARHDAAVGGAGRARAARSRRARSRRPCGATTRSART